MMMNTKMLPCILVVFPLLITFCHGGESSNFDLDLKYILRNRPGKFLGIPCMRIRKGIKCNVQNSLNSKEGIDSDIPSAAPGPAPAPSNAGTDKNPDWLSTIGVLLGVGLFCIFIYAFCLKVIERKEQRETQKASWDIPAKVLPAKDPEVENHFGIVFFVEKEHRFRMEDLMEATADLQSQNISSSLYKVILRNATYAVKRLKKLQVSVDEFGRTMRRIGNLKHPNILPLVAYKTTDEEKLLIYHYQTNGSLLNLLESYIEGKRDFPWKLRMSIASGVARGLAFVYQSQDGKESIPHGNIKLSNILLGDNMEPFISEYGISTFLDPKKNSLFSSHAYVAPEKSMTEKGDVYSFGIILLELLTGKNVEKTGIDLPKWVKSMVREEWTGEVFDKEVSKEATQLAVPLLNISLKCVSVSPQERPTMAEVVEKIEEVMNTHDELSVSSMSSWDSNHHESCILHKVIPETWDTPGSNY